MDKFVVYIYFYTKNVSIYMYKLHFDDLLSVTWDKGKNCACRKVVKICVSFYKTIVVRWRLHFTDGSFIVTTPVDPVFLVLPYLIDARKVGSEVTHFLLHFHDLLRSFKYGCIWLWNNQTKSKYNHFGVWECMDGSPFLLCFQETRNVSGVRLSVQFVSPTLGKHAKLYGLMCSPASCKQV